MKKIFTLAAAILASFSLFAADNYIALTDMTLTGSTYSYDGSEIKAKNNNLYVELPSADVNGTFTVIGSSNKSDRYLYIYGTNGTVKDETRKMVMTVDGASVAFTATDVITKNEKPYLLFSTTDDFKTSKFSYTYESSIPDHTKATVKSISVDGVKLADFAAEQFVYNIELAYGTTAVPTVTAVAGDEANININPATALPGATTVVCTSYDGLTTVTYTLNFTVAASASTDATLKSLKINGTAVAGFKADSLNYAYEIAYVDALPVVTAEANDENANAVVTDVTEVPGTATVLVTAQDGTTTLTYSIAFTRAAAIKKINEVILSNKYSAYILEGQVAEPYVINGYYLAGQEAPTVESYKVNEGTTWAQEGNTITLTGVDASTATYALTLEAVTPLEFTADEITFDGSETWIKGGYGFDASKKWRFSKTDNDYSREIAGKTHLELFLPACDSIALLEANVASRDIKVYINGVQFGEKVTLAKNQKLGLKVAQSAAFMLTIASAQTSGDGGIVGIQLFKDQATAINNTEAEVKVNKFFQNGQLFIEKNGVIYNAQGAVVR